MAQRTEVILTDDLDGGQADETVTFGLEGRTYEIDLSSKNADKLRKYLAQYVDKARRSGNVTPIRGRGRSVGSSGVDPKAVRAWAEANQVTVSARGRISAEVVEQFHAAGN